MKLALITLLALFAIWQAIPDSQESLLIGKEYDLGDVAHPRTQWEPWEYIDVPAIEETIDHWGTFATPQECWKREYMPMQYCEKVAKRWELRHWTCAEKSRILLSAEDGAHWCHKVQP